MNLADIPQNVESGFDVVAAISAICPNLVTLIIGV
jgi:hypothetical protein